MNITLPALQELNFTANTQTQEFLHSYFENRAVVEDIRGHYYNGLSKYIQKISIEIVTEREECKKLGFKCLLSYNYTIGLPGGYHAAGMPEWLKG